VTEKIDNLSRQQEESQINATKVAIFGSIVLFLISAVVGIMVDSITLILDASASVVIIFVSFLMHFSIKRIHRPADDRYNFGYAKYEPFTVTVQGILILATCITSIKFAIQDIVHAEDVTTYGLPTVATFISGIIGIFIVLYFRRIARQTHSAMLKAASLHWMTDTVLAFGISLGFLIGLTLHNLGYTKLTPYVDPVMAIILALIFIQPALKAMTHNVLELLDAAPTEDIREKVKRVVDEHKPKAFGVQSLRTRKAGERVFVEACFIVPDDLKVIEMEELAKSFEKSMENHFTHCDTVVHFKPVKSVQR
jgi:cation diffusion facilitator family transporter